jgi:hypothetical protein
LGKHREVRDADKEDAREGPEVEEEPEEDVVELTNSQQKVLATMKELDGTIVPGEKCRNCWTAASYVYEKAGITHNCVYSDVEGKQYFIEGIKIEMVAESTATFQVAENPKRDCFLNKETENINEGIKLDALKAGYLLSSYYGTTGKYPKGAPHNIIFIEWIDKDKRIAKLFDWNGDALSNGEKDSDGKKCMSEDFYPGKNYCKTYRYYEEDLSDDEHPVYMVWRPVGIAREKWTLDSAIEEVKTLRLSYLDNKGFVDQLYEDDVLTEEEYNDMIGEGTFSRAKSMTYLKNLLLAKKAG